MRKFIAYFIQSLLITTLIIVFPAHALKTTLLYVLFDAGETLALEPVMLQNEQNGVDYKILAVGTAERLMRHHAHLLQPDHICHIKLPDNPERQQSLNKNILHKLTACIKPNIIITGMVSRFQSNIVKQYKQDLKTNAVGFYDSFNVEKNIPWLNELSKYLDTAITANSVIAQSLKATYPAINPIPLGHPTIDIWRSHMEKNKHNFPEKDSRPRLLYVAGYGKPFIGSFKSFLEAARSLSLYDIMITPHPKTGGEIIGPMIESVHLDYIQIVKDKGTMEMASKVDVIVCHQSTACVQAALSGKPVVYFDTSFSNQNWLIKNKKIPIFSDINAFVNYITKSKQLKPATIDPIFNVPHQSTQRIAQWLHNKLDLSTTNQIQ